MKRALLLLALPLLGCQRDHTTDQIASRDLDSCPAAPLPQRAAPDASEEEAARPPALTDAPLEAYRAKLLDVAFEAVSKLPLDPHVKNRARAQGEVVTAALELGQAHRAAAYAAEIPNWRKGLGLAQVAVHRAEAGDEAAARWYVDRAHEVLVSDEVRREQAWRRDRIRVHVAQALVLLGDDEAALPYESGLVLSETGKVGPVRARFIEEESLDEQLATLEQISLVNGFDQLRNALDTCAALYGRFYRDEEARGRVLAAIRGAWDPLPPQVRIEIVVELVEHALEHDDRPEALELVELAHELFGAVRWLPESRVELAGDLAVLRARAGDVETARKEADAALACFDREQRTIVDIHRAGTLRSLAESYLAMGNRAAAAAMFRRALEAGVENPNSRPRANDLAETCCALARIGFEPDQAMWKRIDDINAGLKDPW